jgi:hypothetical protein
MNFISNNDINDDNDIIDNDIIDNNDNNINDDDNNERNELTKFWISFNNECNSIRSILEQLDNDSSSNGNSSSSRSDKENDDIIQNLKQRTVSLQVYATDSTRLMPPYDIRRTQEEIEKLNKNIKDIEAKIKPKKKFSFASRNKNKEKDTTTTTTSNTSTTTTTSIPIEVDVSKTSSIKVLSKELPGSYTIIDKHKETISLTTKELTFDEGVRAQLFIKNCTNCIISARSLLGSVRLENVNDCKIVLGPCCTSVYLEDCHSNTIHIACHQLRIHKSSNCKLFVKCNGHPIIEDCNSMGFAPYFAKYNDIDDDFNTSSLINANCWSNVVDFRWHRTTPSPNWHLLLTKDIIDIKKDTDELKLIDIEWGFDIDTLTKSLLCSSDNVKVDDANNVNHLKVTKDEENEDEL